MSEMKPKFFKIVFTDDGLDKVARGYIEDPDAQLVKVVGQEGTIYINRGNIIFMRELI